MQMWLEQTWTQMGTQSIREKMQASWDLSLCSFSSIHPTSLKACWLRHPIMSLLRMSLSRFLRKDKTMLLAALSFSTALHKPVKRSFRASQQTSPQLNLQLSCAQFTLSSANPLEFIPTRPTCPTTSAQSPFSSDSLANGRLLLSTSCKPLRIPSQELTLSWTWARTLLPRATFGSRPFPTTWWRFMPQHLKFKSPQTDSQQAAIKETASSTTKKALTTSSDFHLMRTCLLKFWVCRCHALKKSQGL